MTEDIFGSFGKIMEQAKQLQSRVQEATEQAERVVVEGSAGAGMVKVGANGKGELVSVFIEPSLVEEGDVDMIQDLIRAAANDALSRARETMAEEMKKVAGGFPLPPGFNLGGG